VAQSCKGVSCCFHCKKGPGAACERKAGCADPFHELADIMCQQAAGVLREVDEQCITFTEVVQQALQQA